MSFFLRVASAAALSEYGVESMMSRLTFSPEAKTWWTPEFPRSYDQASEPTSHSDCFLRKFLPASSFLAAVESSTKSWDSTSSAAASVLLLPASEPTSHWEMARLGPGVRNEPEVAAFFSSET